MKFFLLTILFLVSCKNNVQRDGIWSSLRSYEIEYERTSSSQWIWPVRGEVSSLFGVRQHPIKGFIQHHGGIDIAAPFGSPVFAVADGKITFAGEKSGYGRLVIVQHKDGNETYYGHNRLLLAEKNDLVKQGSPIAIVGSTGLSTGPHLHFEIRKNGSSIDPVSFISSQ